MNKIADIKAVLEAADIAELPFVMEIMQRMNVQA